jgi:hypothetical protein
MKMQMFATLDKANPDTKRTKLDGGRAYDRLSDQSAVVAGAANDRVCSAVLSLK